MPIALTERSTSLSITKSTRRARSPRVSVRVATLKMSARCAFAKKALARKLLGDGVDLKLWKERIRCTFCLRARASNDLNARAERSSTSTYLAYGKKRRSKLRRFWSERLLGQPSRGSRAGMITGADKIDILRSS